jgi:predicted glycosyltransferase
VRIALYSHDALGLGHLRRNLAIARALTGRRASTLVVTGVREAGPFPAPDGVDYLTLPGYAKGGDGGYRSRFLNVTTQRLATLRAETMRVALQAFSPDVLIVDKHPLGLGGELVPALDALRGGTRCILGLRDILDRPDRVRREWVAAGSEAAVREHFDEVWIYGDPRVYDLVEQCSFGPAVRERARYTGYLGSDRSAPAPAESRTGRRLALCVVGYNTVCELLAREKRTLIVPRVAPRQEQLIRSRCLGRHRVVDVVHPGAASPRTVGDWLAQRPRGASARASIDLGGLRRLPALLDSVVADTRVAGHAA